MVLSRHTSIYHSDDIELKPFLLVTCGNNVDIEVNFHQNDQFNILLYALLVALEAHKHYNSLLEHCDTFQKPM